MLIAEKAGFVFMFSFTWESLSFGPKSAQGLLLALISRITPGSTQETMWDAGLGT